MNKDNNSNGSLSLKEAVEILSSVTEEEKSSTDLERMKIENPKIDGIFWKGLDWIDDSDPSEVVDTVKEVFKVILHHIKKVCEDEGHLLSDAKNLDGVKSIMVLVGQAAKKIDRHLKDKKQGSVLELREYKQLQDFYQRKISKTIDQGLLGRWILALTQQAFIKDKKQAKGLNFQNSAHVFVDIDGVKKDTDYELFLIRKEDGTRFFNPRLVRNITLVSDFSQEVGLSAKDKDPLSDLPLIVSEMMHKWAIVILKETQEPLRKWFKIAANQKDKDLYRNLNMAILALFSAANPRHLLSNNSSKDCKDYFTDFQNYLRKAITTREFKEWEAFEKTKKFSSQEGITKDLIQSILQIIYTKLPLFQAAYHYKHLIQKEALEIENTKYGKNIEEAVDTLHGKFSKDFADLQKAVKKHSFGPINKILKVLEEEEALIFNPLIQEGIPYYAFSIYEKDKKALVHILPSPTAQDSIDKATIDEEFLVHLRNPTAEKTLLINYQDRTAWREHARAKVIEQLDESTTFESPVTVATLPKDTEFYFQETPYSEDHATKKFEHHFIEQLLDEQTGFYFSDTLREGITKEMAKSIFELVQKMFFSQKNVLTKEARLAFIDIYYAILEWKLIDLSKASKIYLICKDGVDVSAASASSLYIFMKMISNEGLTHSEMDSLEELMFSKSILTRERMLSHLRFQRMISMIKVIERAKEELGEEAFPKMLKEALRGILSKDMLSSFPSFSTGT